MTNSAASSHHGVSKSRLRIANSSFCAATSDKHKSRSGGSRYMQQTGGTSSDRSQRFILPEDSPYLANLAALWAANVELAQAIESLGDAESYVSEASKAGPHTLALPGVGGKKIYLHSR